MLWSRITYQAHHVTAASAASGALAASLSNARPASCYHRHRHQSPVSALTQQRVIKPPAWTCDATNESFQSPCHNIILTKSFDRRVRIENLVAGRPGRTQGLVGLQPKVLDINIIQRAFAYSRVCGKVCFMASARDAVAFITKCNNATLGFSIFSRHLASTIELLSVTTDLWRILCYPWYLDYTA